MKRNDFIKNIVFGFVSTLLPKFSTPVQCLPMTKEEMKRPFTLRNREEGETTMAVSECKWEEGNLEWVYSEDRFRIVCFVECKPGRYRFRKP